MSIFNLLGISTAYAAEVAPHSAGQSFMSFLPMLIILVLFMYLLIIRPQSKRAKQQKELMNSLKKGDEIMTTGGLVGKISKISDNFIVLSIAENVEITIQKAAVAVSLPKGTMKTAK